MADYLHTSENMPNYGREIANEVGIGALMLHLDLATKRKKHCSFDMFNWGLIFSVSLKTAALPTGCPTAATPAAGNGRSCAGIVLDDAQMRSVGALNIFFGEDAQTFYVSQTDIDMTHSPDPRAAAVEYEQSDLGLPEWGLPGMAFLECFHRRDVGHLPGELCWSLG
ncbi:MAG: hypothetical protein PVH87_05260 [Desulfobacteraceae bacterium]|jgi:hypothetical protein